MLFVPWRAAVRALEFRDSTWGVVDPDTAVPDELAVGEYRTLRARTPVDGADGVVPSKVDLPAPDMLMIRSLLRSARSLADPFPTPDARRRRLADLLLRQPGPAKRPTT